VLYEVHDIQIYTYIHIYATHTHTHICMFPELRILLKNCDSVIKFNIYPELRYLTKIQRYENHLCCFSYGSLFTFMRLLIEIIVQENQNIRIGIKSKYLIKNTDLYFFTFQTSTVRVISPRIKLHVLVTQSIIIYFNKLKQNSWLLVPLQRERNS